MTKQKRLNKENMSNFIIEMHLKGLSVTKRSLQKYIGHGSNTTIFKYFDEAQGVALKNLNRRYKLGLEIEMRVEEDKD